MTANWERFQEMGMGPASNIFLMGTFKQSFIILGHNGFSPTPRRCQVFAGDIKY